MATYLVRVSEFLAEEFLFDEARIIGVDLSKKNESENDNNIITLISSWKIIAN